MAISNSPMATPPHMWTMSLPTLPKLSLITSSLRVQTTRRQYFCYPLLHHVAATLAKGPGPLPCSLSSSSSTQNPLDQGTHVAQESQIEKKLILEIDEELASFEWRDMATMESTLLINEALLLVDLIQRLGIQRYFEHRINGILRSTYREWREESGLVSPGITVLAFRLLRLNGYTVSSDVIEALKDPNGGFSSCFNSIQSTPREVSDMLNLYRCSQTAFPFESEIMDEANRFARVQLSKAVSLRELDPLLQTNNLRREIEFALEYPRQCLLPRLESRSIVKQLWPGDGTINKCLELAKLDMDMLQMLHLKEIEELERWWAALGLNEFAFAERVRRGIPKIHFSISTTLFEPQFSTFRLAFVKTASFTVLTDDLFDQHLQLQEVNCFREAVQRWDFSILDDQPLQHKAVFRALYDTTVELADESSKVQGRDLLPFFKSLWEDIVTAYAMEAEWKYTHHTPTLEDYMMNAKVSIAAPICMLMPIFLMGELITMEASQHISKDSRFMNSVSVVSRLYNDIATFKREERDGEMNSSISCYMRDNPHCTQEDAIAFIRSYIESTCLEVEWEHFRLRSLVPECCSRAFLTFARTMSFIYKRVDAYSNSSDDREYEMLFRDYYYNPLVHACLEL